MIKILAIDDQADNLLTLRAVIKNHLSDFQVFTASSGAQGIQLAKDILPDTILLDIIMPDMDGFEACKILKQCGLTSHIPIIMLTAIKTDTKNRVKGLELGADAFLSKPIDAVELAAQVKVMIRIKKAEDKLRADKDTLEEIVKRKTASLLESEQKYRMLYDFAPLPYQSLNTDGKIIDINPEWLNMLGYKRDEVVGKRIGDFLHPDDQKTFKKYFPRLKEKGLVHNIPFKLRQKNGMFIDIALEGRATYTDDGRFKQTYCVFQDVSERRRSENIQKTHIELIEYSLHHNIDEFLTEFLDKIEDITSSKIAFFNFIEEDQKNLALQAWSTNTLKHFNDSEIESYLYPISEAGAWVDCIKERKPIIHNDYESLSHKKGMPTGHPLLIRELVLPIIRDEKVMAIIGVGNKETDYKEFDIHAIQHLTSAIWEIVLRYKSDKKLRDSEERFRRAITMAPNPIMIHDEDDNVLQLSRGWTYFSGYTIEDIPTVNNWTQKAYGEKQSSSKEYIDKLFELNETENNGIWDVKSKNGEIKKWQFFSTPLGKFENNKKVLLSVAFDITERIKAQEELTKLTVAVEQSANTIVITDIEGNIEYVNPAFTKISSYTAEEALGQNPRLLNAGTLPKEYYKEMWETISAGNIWEGEFHNKTKGGDLFWEHVIITPIKNKNGGITNYLAVKENITEQKLALEKLKTSEYQYRTLFENAGDGIFIVNSDIETVMANEAFAKMHGYSMEEINGIDIKHLNTPESAAKMPGRIKKLLSGEAIRFKVSHFHKNGSKVTLDVTACPVTHKENTEIVAFHRDITEQEKTKQNLISALEKANESDRLKTAFLHNVSHEIRTPMNGIMGFSELLKSPDLSPQAQSSYLDVISKSGQRMLNTLNQLMDMSILETGQAKLHYSTVNINNELDQLLSFFSLEAENKGLSLCFNKLLDDDFEIRTDQGKLYDVLSNLVKNAIKYSRKGEIEFGCRQKGGDLEFYVSDQGIGIPKSRQDAVFERFVQADIEDKKVFEGAGLGLSISKSYVEMLGGKIWLESEEGLGSTFYFKLPFIENKEIFQKKDNFIFSDEDFADKNLKILIAEDEEIADKFLTIILSEYNFNILHAQNGIETIKIIKENPDIDLILMDIKMPIMGGYEATKEIRKFNKKVKIIAQTAFALSGDREKAISAGCDEYISKPIDKDKLLRIISNLI